MSPLDKNFFLWYPTMFEHVFCCLAFRLTYIDGEVVYTNVNKFT